MSFLGTLVLLVSISTFAGTMKKGDPLSLEIVNEMILSPEEEMILANEALSPVEDILVNLSQEIYIYDQEDNLIKHATGSVEELLQNSQLQAMIAESHLLMGDGGDKYYVKRK
ncbi:hypothetical protein [Xanthovirga aplysinae]|uniref:hypothetical protein n=1 Tax=Xanthovirga aplysinae TaxID=2529853 RepID=UPI001CA41151|nr:hypothetical protein [Xanthovirga aplysinae]MTI30720.1 hypothetical protein [Xanthovirga aplysinae]